MAWNLLQARRHDPIDASAAWANDFGVIAGRVALIGEAEKRLGSLTKA
jgi:hypothetical protein